jgi:hypothetical protein
VPAGGWRDRNTLEVVRPGQGKKALFINLPASFDAEKRDRALLSGSDVAAVHGTALSDYDAATASSTRPASSSGSARESSSTPSATTSTSCDYLTAATSSPP